MNNPIIRVSHFNKHNNNYTLKSISFQLFIKYEGKITWYYILEKTLKLSKGGVGSMNFEGFEISE